MEHQVVFRINESEWEKLSLLAARVGTTRSFILRTLIDQAKVPPTVKLFPVAEDKEVAGVK